MKISKTAVLVLGGIFATLGLGLMVVNAAEKTLTMDLKNAVQHFKTVRLITTSDNSGVELNRIDGPLVEISGANNFIITTGGTEETQINQILNVRNSSILGGKGNKINNGGGGGNYDVILGGEGNLMDGSDKNFYNVILGGKGNQIHNSRHSVILGGEGNIINSNSSYDTAIGNKNTLGGSYSVAIGYKNTLSSSYSAAVGSNGTVGGTRSFLWTNDTLSVGEGDVFVVNGENGMVVNANKAHSFAKLTVGGSLVIGTKDISAGEGGMIKVLNGTNGRKCFCSHNGSGRNSLHGGGSCAPICNGTQKNPKCAATADVTCNGKVFNVENGCEIGSVVAGTGAFFIDNGNYIHWACESENGNVTTSLNPSVDCKQKIPDGQCGTSKPEAGCGGERDTCTKGDLYTEITKPDDENYWYWYCKYGAESIKECHAAKAKRTATCTAPSLAAGTWEWVNSTFTQVNVGGEWIPSSKSAQYSTNSSVECSFKCKEPNYSWNGSSCVSAGFSCQGPVPANATLIPGSDKNLTKNENRRLYLSVAAAGSNKCAYICNDTHEFKNGVCVKKSYECAKTLENKYKCLHNGIYVDGTNTSHANNEYMWFCNNGTTKCGICDDGTKANPPHNGACLNAGKCVGEEPANANLIAGTDVGVVGEVPRQVYKNEASVGSNKCAYVCKSDYTYIVYMGIPQCVKCVDGTYNPTDNSCEIDVGCGGKGYAYGPKPGEEGGYACLRLGYCSYNSNFYKTVQDPNGEKIDFKYAQPWGTDDMAWSCSSGTPSKYQCQYKCKANYDCFEGKCVAAGAVCPSKTNGSTQGEPTWGRGTYGVDKYAEFRIVGNGGNKWDYDQNETKTAAGCYFKCINNSEYGTHPQNDGVKGCIPRMCASLPSYANDTSIVSTKENNPNQYNQGWEFVSDLSKCGNNKCCYTCDAKYQFTAPGGKTGCKKEVTQEDKCPSKTNGSTQGEPTWGRGTYGVDKYAEFRIVGNGGNKWDYDQNETKTGDGCYFKCINNSEYGTHPQNSGVKGCIPRMCASLPSYANDTSIVSTKENNPNQYNQGWEFVSDLSKCGNNKCCYTCDAKYQFTAPDGKTGCKKEVTQEDKCPSKTNGSTQGEPTWGRGTYGVDKYAEFRIVGNGGNKWDYDQNETKTGDGCYFKCKAGSVYENHPQNGGVKGCIPRMCASLPSYANDTSIVSTKENNPNQYNQGWRFVNYLSACGKNECCYTCDEKYRYTRTDGNIGCIYKEDCHAENGFILNENGECVHKCTLECSDCGWSEYENGCVPNVKATTDCSVYGSDWHLSINENGLPTCVKCIDGKKWNKTTKKCE